MKKTVAGASTYFVYDEAGHLTGEYDGLGNLVHETVWFSDVPVAVLKPNASGVNVFYIHSDHLNTPRRISRPSDDVIMWRWDSDPFGRSAANEDPDGDSNSFAYNPRFPGQYYDAESGLHYNYFRDYDSTVGRFVQSDPLGLTGGLNTYAYVRSNPLEFRDPYGLQEEVPEDETGVGTEAQKACDNAADEAKYLREADAARREGDWDTYYDKLNDAFKAQQRYWDYYGIKLPNDAFVPRGPTPPPTPENAPGPTPSFEQPEPTVPTQPPKLNL